MSGIVCPLCDQGPEKCRCDNGVKSFATTKLQRLVREDFKIKICKECNYLSTCCDHGQCTHCGCKHYCWVD